MALDAWTAPRLRVCGGIQVFGGYWDLALVEECGRGRHSLLIQHNTQRSAARQSQQRRTPEKGHAPQTLTPAQHPMPRAGARPTTWAIHPCTSTAANKQGTHAGHHQRPTTPHPTPTPHPPHKTTKATRTHTTQTAQKGCFPDAPLEANTFPTTPGSGGNPNLSRGAAPAGAWQPGTRLTIGQRPKACAAHE